MSGNLVNASVNTVDYVLQAWNETQLHNLQQEYNFLSEKDTRRDQSFQPLAILKQEHGESKVEFTLSYEENGARENLVSFIHIMAIIISIIVSFIIAAKRRRIHSAPDSTITV